MGDFTGFSFGSWHSTDPTTGVVNIIRVSGGDRYDEQLHPEIKDRTAEVPGLNGEYYFGSDFGSRSFDIEFAFDYLTEAQFRELRKVFGTKQIKKLIFDERPYKYYMAKLESPVELSYVCFDEPIKVNTTIEGIRYKTDNGYDNTHVVKRSNSSKQRIYKGEGKVSFICYFPFAKSNFKVLPSIGDEYYKGSEEWAISSGILSADEALLYDTYTISSGDTPYIKIYNPGDIPTGFRLYCPFGGSGQLMLKYQPNDESDFEILTINYPTPKRNGGTDEEPTYDTGFLIDTNSELIIGVSAINGNSYTTSGNLYNDSIESGYFFKLQPVDVLNNAIMYITNGNENMRIFYDYLYF